MSAGLMYRIRHADGDHWVEDGFGRTVFCGTKRDCFGFVREELGLGPMPKARA